MDDEKKVDQEPSSNESGESNQPTYPDQSTQEPETVEYSEVKPDSNEEAARGIDIEDHSKFSSVAGISGNKKIILAAVLGVAAAVFLYNTLPDTRTESDIKAEKRKALDEKKEEIIKTAEPVVAPREDLRVISQPKFLEPPQVSAPQPPEPPPAPAPLTPQAPSFPEISGNNDISPPTFSVPSVSNNQPVSSVFSSREDEEKRRKAKQDRRSSNIMVLGGGGGVGSAAAGGLEGQDGSQAAQQQPPKKSGEGFLGFGEGTLTEATLSRTGSDQVTATYIGDLKNTIAQGKIIDAVLETAINTDLPGAVRGIVSRDVYSEAGKNVLIPKGSRVIGEYSAQIRSGQVRVSILWSRLIRPDGVDIALDAPASDRLGRAGVVGHLDNKFWTRMGAAFLISYVIPTLSNRLANVNDDSIQSTATTSADGTQSVTSTGTVGSTQAQESADEFKDLASKVIEDSFSEKPTIMIDQGAKINIMVNKDLVFPNVPSFNNNLLK